MPAPAASVGVLSGKWRFGDEKINRTCLGFIMVDSFYLVWIFVALRICCGDLLSMVM